VSIVDERGRLFGRVNLVDGAVAAFLLLLVPLGYATYLLFRPSAPSIESVTPTAVTKEEERITIGGRPVAKFKVRGNGFTPLLRARVGDADALGFVFENPNSADVLVGAIPPGAHDLVLLDGRQEVARARGAISTEPAAASMSTVRAVGWLVNLDDQQTTAIAVGTSLPPDRPAYRVVALGPVAPAFRRLSTIDVPVDNRYARRALLSLKCDIAASNPCAAMNVDSAAPVTISLPGPGGSFAFEIEELLPPTPATPATLRMRLTTGGSLPIRQGDRDVLLDERAAVVSSVAGEIVTLDLGIDRGRDGWRYRGQRVVPGAPFTFTTDRYEAAGVVQSVEPKTPQP